MRGKKNPLNRTLFWILSDPNDFVIRLLKIEMIEESGRNIIIWIFKSPIMMKSPIHFLIFGFHVHPQILNNTSTKTTWQQVRSDSLSDIDQEINRDEKSDSFLYFGFHSFIHKCSKTLQLKCFLYFRFHAFHPQLFKNTSTKVKNLILNFTFKEKKIQK